MNDTVTDTEIKSLETLLAADDSGMRWRASDELRRLFLQAWREKHGQKRSTSALRRCEQIRGAFSRSCYVGDTALTDTIVTAALEHLFQTPDILQFFSEWRKDTVLRPVFAEARYIATGFKEAASRSQWK